jgi:hypothetical protein
MSNYGQPSSSPPDPWNDQTVSYPPPAVPPSSGPPAYQPGSASPAYPGPQNPPAYGQPAYEPTQYQPAYQQPGYDQGYQQPGYGQPQYPAPKKSHTVTILVIVLAVVVLGAIAAGVLLYQRNGSGTATAPPAAVNECVVSNGQPTPNVGLNKAACGPGSFKILKIVPGTSDQSICQTVPNANEFFAYKWPADTSKSYVLCMQSQ